MLEPSILEGPDSAIDYVALGDSYTSGPFITAMRQDPSGCARSRDNYPAFLADWLDVASYIDVSCSGAVTDDLTGRQRTFDGDRVPPQLSALGPGTELVTMGIGGNDFDLFTRLVACRGAARDCPPSVAAEMLRDARSVKARVARAVRQVLRRAPDAEVYVVGYPQILPADGPCRPIGLSAASAAGARRVADRLNESLRQGAKAAGASYVDLATPSEGHDVCAGDEAWVNGPDFRAGVAAPFHPMIEGMRAAAAVIYEDVTGEEPEVTEYADPDSDAVVINPQR